MSAKDSITLGQLIEMQPGTKEKAVWINSEFEAAVSDVKIGSGKAPSTAVLSDPHTPSISIIGNFFGTDPSRYVGKICHFSGKGMTRTEYKGVQQVTIGDKATVQVVGSAPAGAGKAAGGVAGHPASGAIHGATVGMAINQACENLRLAAEKNPPQSIDGYFASAGYSKELWTMASDIIRIARLLESGKLADAPKVRNEDPQDKAKREEEEKKKAAEAEAARLKKEEEERRAANQNSGGAGAAQDDVPFNYVGGPSDW